MHTNCPTCGLRYEKEPGNFYGAMYVSYGFSTAIFLVTAFAGMPATGMPAFVGRQACHNKRVPNLSDLKPL
ncbi:MAG: hypothetical protein AAGA66_18855 [Bacteroidota bacterium]